MPSCWGPSNEELTNAQTHQFSASYDSIAPLDQISDEDNRDSAESEAEGDGGTDDHFANLFDLAEAANLVDVYHADIIPLVEDFGLSTPNNSPRKRKHF
jgi:hypothetical protein